jgi:hypothetical protein
MAQVAGGSNRDWVFASKANACGRLLEEAATAYARNGLGAARPDDVASGVLKIWAVALPENLNTSNWQWPVRFLPAWLEGIEAPEVLCSRVLPASGRTDCTGAIPELLATVREAARMWSLGDPSDPPPATVLEVVVGSLWRHRLSTRPPWRSD